MTTFFYARIKNEITLVPIVGSLSHYVDADDLRLEDEWIRDMQSKELLKLIEMLKKNSSEDELRKITFLRYSDGAR